MKLDEKELLNVKGGEGVSLGLIAGVSAMVAFLIGIIDGFYNPKKCEVCN